MHNFHSGRVRTDRARRGVTVVELAVAIVLLTLGMLGLAGVSAAVMRQMRLSANQTIATSLAASRFEQFEGKPCSQITAGSATARGVSESWTVTAVGTRAMTVRDTLSFRGFRGATRKVGLTTTVSCS